MDRAINSLLWVEQGYRLFAENGMEGIQVERLARMLQLNKSGFYHYFGDLEGFCSEMVALHLDKVSLFLKGIRQCKVIDPDYLLLLARFSTTVMFQVQLTRTKERYEFYKASEIVDQQVSATLQKLWSQFLGTEHNPDLSLRYFHMVRDMFYTRISFDNLNYPFLHDFATNAKSLVDQVLEQAAQQRSRSH